MLAPMSVAGGTANVQHLRVLVVEDEASLRNALVDLLFAEGWTAAAASDGADAWRMLDDFRPDIILLDLVMPNAQLDGFGLLARLRDSRVPIVVISALGPSLSDVLHDRTVSVLAKPVSADVILGEIRRLAGVARTTT
jgi:two-component system, OmpR family, response regulator